MREGLLRHLRLLVPLIGLAAVLVSLRLCDCVRRHDQEIAVGYGNSAYRILDVSMPQVIYQEAPQCAALEDYAQRTRLPLKVNWKILQAQGIDPAVPISVGLHNVKVGKGLQVLLDAVSVREHQLDYVIDEDGAIEVITDRTSGERAVVEVYDVSDLFTLIPEAPDSKTRDELIQDVTTLVTDTVDPHTWEINGGGLGRIHYFHGKLVVTQTPAGHRLLCNLLEQLREARLDVEHRRLESRFLYGEGGNP